MVKRKIVHIDEEKCDGCGLCVNACVEGAIKILNGKAVLIDDIYCDGIGACLGSCPKGAITIVEKEAKPFSEEAVHKKMNLITKKETPTCECLTLEGFHKLSNWPIQLKLVPVNAPFLKDADLLIAADCTAFSFKKFHEEILKDRKLIIACPKLDDSRFYLDKLTEIFRNNNVKSVVILRMTVPCCGGLTWLVNESIKRSGKNIEAEEKVIGIEGTVK